jgi:hypothetical protein
VKRSVNLKSVRVIYGRESEIHRGWVRLSEDLRDCVRNRAYVRLVYGGCKVHCQIMGNPKEEDCLEMSEYYRDKLGLAPGEVFGIEIEEVGPCGRIRAWCAHPDDTVRVALTLGLVGVSLGLIGLALGLISLFH